MDESRRSGPAAGLPRLPLALLRRLLPHAEREEVLTDLAAEHAERVGRHGVAAARAWLWMQVAGSVPALVRRSWWRGRTGFEPASSRMRPGGPGLESWIMDARYAVRRLRTRPAYALLAVVTLALGVGGTAAVWGIARGLLVAPLPYAREGELVAFWNPFDWSQAEFAHLRPDFPGFRRVAMYRTTGVILAAGDEAPRVVPAVSSSAELLEVLGTRPLVGRGFQPGDDASGAEPAAVLSYGLWRELGGDPGIVGRRLRLNGVERTVTGVMPEGFWFPDPSVRVWLTFALDPEDGSGNYALVGRLAPGRTVAGMGDALRRITASLGERFRYPEQWDKTKNASLVPLREYLVGEVRPALLATLAAMAVILLIACANVAALMLGQVDGRAAELAVRTALGAGRRRLLQQLVAEALLVGVLAGGAGAALAAGAFRLLVGALPLGALAAGAALDWTVFWAAMAIALAAALAVTVVPAASLWRGDLRGALGRQRTAGIGGRGGRVEGTLVVAEVALAVMMAAGAALLVRSVAKLRAVDPGVATRGVAVLEVAMPADETPARHLQTVRELEAGLAAVPGVRAVGAAKRLPLRGGGDNWGIRVEGRPELASSTTYLRLVSPDYLRVMGVRLLAGRGFEAGDVGRAEPPVVVNRALARKYFPGLDPLGRRIAYADGWMRIVGVVDDVAEGKLTDPAAPAAYVLFGGVPYLPPAVALVLRVAPGREPAAVLEAARQRIRRVAPGAAVQQATTMTQVFAEAIGPARQLMSLLALLAGLALVLGAVGVYGVISHYVSRRGREWGIRMALGLRPARVLGHVVGRGGALVAAGAAIGVIGFLGLARLLSTFLYGVGTADPLALGAAAGGLLLVGVVAALVPARRAASTDPAVVLRET